VLSVEESKEIRVKRKERKQTAAASGLFLFALFS
jgi:hypothetical protein